MKSIISAMALFGIALSLSYGGYWLAKHVSYSIFYEDMVKETIRETVNANSLK